jgi:SagB-type dehydrogenase family enzyme
MIKKGKKSLTDFKAVDQPLLMGITSLNSQGFISAYGDSIAVNEPEAMYSSMWYKTEAQPYEEFLLNLIPSIRSYVIDLGVAHYRTVPALLSLACRDVQEIVEEESIHLPKPKSVKAPLSSVIESRRSRRDCTGEPMDLRDLSTILKYSCGVSGRMPLILPPLVGTSNYFKDKQRLELRNHPSGGGEFPINLYLLALNVDGLERGVYLYSPSHHLLRKKGTVSGKRLENSISTRAYEGGVEKASVIFLFAYEVWRNVKKYGGWGASMALIEIGAMTQNLNLLSIALGYKSCDVAAFNKLLAEDLTGVDGLTSMVLHSSVVGR